MISHNAISIPNRDDKLMLADEYFPTEKTPLSLVIFCHGYKGFKDWGAWHLVAEYFAKGGFFFVKFNFSHNGTTAENPLAFGDLEAFGNNNYGKELDDLETVIAHYVQHPQVDAQKIFLIGHSRGGGIVLLKAFENQGIKAVATWAGVSDFSSRFPKGDRFEQWEETGVFYATNARTGQQMPHYFQFYENYAANPTRFDIQAAVRGISIPQLIVHGTNDEAVPFQEAQQLKRWNTHAKQVAIENANHTLGASHPYTQDLLPAALQQACHETLLFFKGV